MTGSEPELERGAGRGKALAWRSRSSRDMGKVTGRESGSSDAAFSASGRDIGKNIANWWTSAVEQTSTFILDEVPATFVGLSVGAKELKPALTRGSSFSSFTLPWKATGDGSKGVGDSVAERQDNDGVAVSVPEAPKRDSSKAKSPKPLEISLSRKLVETGHDPSASSPKLLQRSHSRKSAEKGHEPSVASPKRMERVHSRKLAEKGHDEPIVSLPKQLERSPLKKQTKQVEMAYEPIVSSPKPLERSPLKKQTKQVEMACEPVVSPPKQLERSPLKKQTKQVEMADEPIVSSPKQLAAPVSGGETPKQLGKSPLSGVVTPKRSESSPVVTPDPRTGSTGRQGESRRRTKRMVVDAGTSELEASPAQAVCLSTVSQEFLLGESTCRGSAKVHSLEVLQRQQFWTPQKARTDSPDKSNPNSSAKQAAGSSRRSSAARSLARSLHLDDDPLSPQLTAVGTPPLETCIDVRAKPTSVGVVLPRDEIFPGKTTSLPQIKVRTPRVVTDPTSTGLSKNPLIGGSTRVPERDEIRDGKNTRLSGSLPTSPRFTPGESRTTRLLRRLKFTGRGSRTDVDQELGKGMSTGSGRKESLEDVSGSLEPRQLDFSFMNWTDPDLGNNMLRERRAKLTGEHDDDDAAAERSEVTHSGDAVSTSVPKTRRQHGNVVPSEAASADKKSSAWPWTFKWKWGSKARSKAAKGAAAAAKSANSLVPLPRPTTSNRNPNASPSADIMSDARDTFVSRSDRFSSSGNAEKLTCDRAPKHRRVLSWGADTTSALCSGSNPTMAAFTPGQPRLATRDAQELLVPPRKLFVPPNVNGVRRSEHEVVATLPEVRRSQNALRGSAETDIFEDCFGSFRSNDSPPRSFGSFKSIESPSVSVSSTGSSMRKTALSLDADEWDSHVSSSFRQEINGTNDDIPSTSASKFIFKCPKVQLFNKFLRAQKERLRSGLNAGNTDRFCIILTGRELELSAMVAAMGYAWLQENSFPKISGDAWYPVPMIDIPRQQMDKHRDTAWLFDACGIDPGSVLFADEIELSMLVGAGRIKMSIIGQDVLVTRNEVGSVCTLLMEMLLAGHRGLLQPRYLKALMLAGVLLDTENLDFASIRDIEMSNHLVEGMGCFGRTSFFNQLKEAEDDARVSKLITQYYDNQPSARLKLRVEAEHEHSDRDSIFTQSQDHTSTSEAGTNSSLDEDSPRPKLKQRNSFRYSRLTPHSAPARSHRLSMPGGCLDQDAQAVANIRKAATQSVHPSSALPSYGQNPQRAKPGAFARIRKKLFLEG